MIKSDKGVLLLAGTAFDIAFEFNEILTKMAEDCPEILCGVLAERTDALSRAMGKADLEGIKHYSVFTKEYKEAYKEERGHEC